MSKEPTPQVGDLVDVRGKVTEVSQRAVEDRETMVVQQHWPPEYRAALLALVEVVSDAEHHGYPAIGDAATCELCVAWARVRVAAP